jgi:2-polyprenyl-6-methoxyphenol hydroxylase-like FAD-dependent oxidoreductase
MDVLAMAWTTDGLQQLFAQRREAWALLRNWGMRGFDQRAGQALGGAAAMGRARIC